MLTSSALVLLMIPGVGFFYSGLARRKSALSLIWLSCMSVGVVSFQWFFWGYSLTFSHTANSYIGDLTNIGFRNGSCSQLLLSYYRLIQESRGGLLPLTSPETKSLLLIIPQRRSTDSEILISAGSTQCWESENSGSVVCDLSGNVRCDYVRRLSFHVIPIFR